MSTTASLINQLNLVMIPSADPERSIAFYTALGFEKRSDITFGEGHRWVELYPPSGTTGIALAPGGADEAGAHTGIILSTGDIDATHAQLQARGVDVDDHVARAGAPAEIRIGAATVVGPEPSMFYFRDPDGNALLVVGAG
jgi:catechol 2,3-dioxygenase-like lactoylglutathione lyase family enzyme